MKTAKPAPTFRQFLTRRGYDLHGGSGAFLRRMFLSAWAEPGFHRFWRIWNPLYGYFLFRFYRVLGGERRRVPATVTVFVACGFVLHDLPILWITGHPQVATTTAFFFFAVVALLSKAVDKTTKAARWPRPAHVLLNSGLVLGGLLLGAYVQGRFLAS